MNKPLLQCQGLTKRFGGLTAINGLDLDIYPGEILGLLGPNGSGKTTSFNVITGIYRADAGQINFEGRDISSFTAQAVYRAGITRTFQRSRLSLPLSIFDNIMVGNHQHLNHGLWFNLMCQTKLKRQIEENYELAAELIETFNKELRTKLFKAAGSVNMIDRRRIEICRALISKPKLILLDEPSAGMTQDETKELMDDILAVRDRMDGLTIVIIEHEMDAIERTTDRCVVLNYGRKLCEGSYREIVANTEVQEAYLGQS